MSKFNQDPISYKKIGAPLLSNEIHEYSIPFRLAPKNDMSDNNGGYVNFFTYKHPTVEAPNWYQPCFENKQMSILVKPFAKDYTYEPSTVQTPYFRSQGSRR